MEYRFYHICIDQVQQILLIIYNNLFFVISLIKETFPQITDLWPNEIFLDIFETRTICISSSVQKWEYIPPWITELFKSKTSHASKRSVIFNNGNKSRVYDTCIPKFPLSKKKKKKRKKERKKKKQSLCSIVSPIVNQTWAKFQQGERGEKKISDRSLESSVSNFKPCFV